MPVVFVTGANRGLGLEFARQYLDDGWRVIAACRDPDGATELRQLSNDSLDVTALDVADFDAVDRLAAELGDTPIDVLINNAGVFGPKRRADDDPGQSFGHVVDYDIFEHVLRVNTLAPLKIAEALFSNVMASRLRRIVTITSRLGSIAETGPGLYAYRTSKAAVNMAMASLACESEAAAGIVVVVNPGWVKTDMGGGDATLEVADSIRDLRRLIDRLTPDDSGAFLDHDGRRIPW